MAGSVNNRLAEKFYRAQEKCAQVEVAGCREVRESSSAGNYLERHFSLTPEGIEQAEAALNGVIADADVALRPVDVHVDEHQRPRSLSYELDDKTFQRPRGEPNQTPVSPNTHRTAQRPDGSPVAVSPPSESLSDTVAPSKQGDASGASVMVITRLPAKVWSGNDATLRLTIARGRPGMPLDSLVALARARSSRFVDNPDDLEAFPLSGVHESVTATLDGDFYIRRRLPPKDSTQSVAAGSAEVWEWRYAGRWRGRKSLVLEIRSRDGTSSASNRDTMITREIQVNLNPIGAVITFFNEKTVPAVSLLGTLVALLVGAGNIYVNWKKQSAKPASGPEGPTRPEEQAPRDTSAVSPPRRHRRLPTFGRRRTKPR